MQNRLAPHCARQYPIWTSASATSRSKSQTATNGTQRARSFGPHDLVSGLLQREQDALGLGYAGLRTNGNCAWVSQDQWADFLEYERLVQKTVRGRRMICMCSYCMDQLRDGSHLEVMERHDLAVPSALRSPPRRRSSNGERWPTPSDSQRTSVNCARHWSGRNAHSISR